MHIEIVFNKEKKIAQPVLEALESEILKHSCPIIRKQRSEFVRVAPMG